MKQSGLWFIARAKCLREGVSGAIARGIGKYKAHETLFRKTGYYAALALLLVLLGAASYAYRSGRSGTEATPQPRAAIAVSTPAPVQTPEPTPEPPRWTRPLEGEILCGYSPEEPVWSQTLGLWQTHPALDISGSPGEAVYACGDGVVADAYVDRLWGNVIVLEHDDGYRSVYAGVNTLQLVSVGDTVKRGDVLSAVGQSAACESEMPWHLHFEMTKDGQSLDFGKLVE